MALYEHLRKNHIRLLSVSRDGEDGRIIGEFKTVSLEEERSSWYGGEKRKLDYFAVSYVWGSPKYHQIVEVNGHQLTITPNAHAILNFFCDWPQQRKKAWIWIDSVCINQGDNIEKSVQVPLMASIYSRAKRAVVWLGEGNESTDAGMELMRMLAIGKNGYPVPSSVLSDSKGWAGFGEIAKRPWWRRAWTLQESTIPRDLVYYCGTMCLTADEVRSAVLVASTYSYTRTEEPLEKAAIAPIWHRRRIYQWLGHQSMDDDFDGYEHRRPTGQSKFDDIGLLALLAYQRHTIASDPKDYIYSLLGCVKEKDRQLVGPPSYDSDLVEIYRNFVRHWVLAYESLDIIAFAQLFRHTPSLGDSAFPTWVPDWSSRLDLSLEESIPVPLLVSQPNKEDVGSMLPPRFLRRTSNPRHLYEDEFKLPTYAAAGDMALRVAFSKDMKRMECTGVLIGSIDGISASGWDEHAGALIQSTSTLNTQLTSSKEHTTVASDIMLSLQFGRADIYLQYEADAKETLTEMLEALAANDGPEQAFQNWVEVNANLLIRGITLGDALHRANPTELLEKEADPIPGSPRRQEYETSISSKSSKETTDDEESAKHPLSRKFRESTHPNRVAKRLVVTDNGYLAMAPKDVLKGDAVCILFGGSVPMVLRRVSGYGYGVVGECYLQGFMNGEGLERGYATSDFVLV